MSKNTVVKGFFILTSANIITRILGFVYRIYMSNLIGAEGMGLYQLIMPIYMLVWSITSSGFSTTISKLIAEENSKKNYYNINKILKLSVITSGAIAVLMSILVFFLAEFIANSILNDSRTTLSLYIMCLSFPFMSIGSCIRGYFLGLQNTIIPAISQVLEQVARMSCIYFLSSIFISRGIEYACAIGVVGMCVGEIFSFLYVLMVYNNINIGKSNNKPKNNKTTLEIYKIILLMATPLTANRVLNSFLTTIENILIPQKLIEFGYNNSEAMSLYGQLTGMSMPLIMFPASLLTGLAIIVVPAISEAKALNKLNSLENTINKSFLFTNVIGIGSMGLFLTFCDELGLIIYSQDDLGEQLLLLGLLCPLLYTHITFSGILNGLGEQFLIFKNSIISSVINIFFIYYITPQVGLIGFIIGWLLSLVSINLVSYSKLKKILEFKLNLFNIIAMPLVSILISSLLTKNIYNILILNLNNSILNLVLGVVVLGLIYLLLLLKFKIIRIQDFKF
ncbi:MAG: stage V sporulation protein B [bacterium]